MSIAASEPITPLNFPSGSDGSFDLVTMLLEQQQQLTAVEAFSRTHDGDHSHLDRDSPAQEQYYRSLLPASPPSDNQQYAFQVDLDACSGCKACVVACHTLNGLEEDESWRRVGAVTIGDLSDSIKPVGEQAVLRSSGVAHVTTACHHCEDPGCLNGCPVKAYDKDPDTGIVRHLDDQCIGCKYCTMMCPYEVPKYSKRLGIVRKCDMCHHRLAVDEAPACVQSCPNEAIRITLVDRLIPTSSGQPFAAKTGSLAPGAPPSNITTPTTVYLSQSDWTDAVPQDSEIDEVAESHWPLAALLVATQISVGMLLVERLAAIAMLIAGTPMPLLATAIVAALALIVGAVGLNLAPLHLGQPLRAWRVFLGLRTSWLSREAVILGKYMGLLTGAVMLLWLPWIESFLPPAVTETVQRFVPDWLAKFLLGACLPVGVVGLYSSAMIYIATKRPLWTAERTLPRFALTILLGGVGFASLGFAIAAQAEPFESSALNVFVSILAVASALAIGGLLRWQWKLQFGPPLSTDHPHDRRCRKLTWGKLSGLARMRIALAGASVFMLTVLAGTSMLLGATTVWMIPIALVACLVVTASESVDRLLYFMSVVYDRMPGILK